jgi:DNA-directed RNA polymerase specialized sigma24 family protein
VLQEVYKGLLTRNAGRGKFDPRRSSFGHYIHLVCGSILANYHRKMSRRREMEQVGMRGLNCDSGNLEYLDASQASDSMAGHDMLHGGSVVGTEDTAAWSLALEALERHLRASNVGELAIQAMLYAAQGFTRSEIARILDQDPGRVGRALAKLRRATRSWEPELILEGSWGGA